MATTQCKPLPKLSEKDIERFLSNIDRSPGQGPNGKCHRWTGGYFDSGYGRFKAAGRDLHANRVALFLHTGIDPYPLLACHICDWEPCCNGAHLFRGTVLENIEDRDRKGRTARGDRNGSRLHPERVPRGDTHYAHLHPELKQGENNGRSVLTEKQVREIRRRYARGGVSYTDLSREFHLTKGNIAMIVKRRTWKLI